MKGLLLFLISLPLYSNTFELKETGARFKLEITSTELRYRSEVMTERLKLNPCSLELAKQLNEQLFAAAGSSKSDLDFYVDGKNLRGPSSELTVMNEKFLVFLTSEKELCR